jgi:hypothetical protein
MQALDRCSIKTVVSPVIYPMVGHLFPITQDDLEGFLIRLSVPGEGNHGQPLGAPGFGGQLQTKAVFGKAEEAHVIWDEVSQEEIYADGKSVMLSRPVFHLEDAYAVLNPDIMISPRMATPIIGWDYWKPLMKQISKLSLILMMRMEMAFQVIPIWFGMK